MATKENFNKKLLVEGKDDLHVVSALCKKFSISENFDVIDCNGIENIKKQFPQRLKESEIQTIGLIIDADTSLTNNWQSIRNLLLENGFELLEELSENGLIVENDQNIKVGVWIMPNNRSEGIIEDFISFLVPAEDKILPIIDETLNMIESQDLNQYSLKDKSKARIHSWLALQPNPGTPMGAAITKRYLITDQETCSKLVYWLKELFK